MGVLLRFDSVLKRAKKDADIRGLNLPELDIFS